MPLGLSMANRFFVSSMINAPYSFQFMGCPPLVSFRKGLLFCSRFARGTPSVSLRSTDLRRSACLLPAQRAASSTPSKKEPFGAFYDFLQNSPILFHISFISARTVLSITSHTDSKCLSTSALEKRMTVIPYSSRPAVRLSSYAFPSSEKCWLPSNSITNLAFAQ